MGHVSELETLTGTAALRPRLWAQFLAALGASMATSGWAVGIGAGSICIDQLARGVGGFTLTSSQQVWTVSSNFLGTLLGSAGAGFLSSRYGTRSTMLWCCLPAAAGLVLSAMANNFQILLAGRMLVGISSGPAFVLHMFYISAVASPEYRGLLSMLPDIVYMTYVILTLCAGSVLPWWWATIVSGALFAVPAVLALAVVPSDCFWLVATGRLEEAKHSARFFGIEMPTPEADRLQGAQQVGKQSTWHLVRQRSCYRPLLLSAALLVGSGCCGYTAILGYSLVLLRVLHSPLDATLVSVLLCAIRLVTVTVVALLIDRTGRRVLLLSSAAGMIVSYLVVAACFCLPALADVTWLPVTSLILSVLAFCCGVGSVPWCLMAELVPARLVDAVGAALVFWYQLASLVSVQLFPVMLSVLGVAGTFVAHAVVVLVLFVLVLLGLPETRGLSLIQIEELFEESGSRNYRPVKELPTQQGYNTVGFVGGG